MESHTFVPFCSMIHVPVDINISTIDDIIDITVIDNNVIDRTM
uniref:Uncharacterized protein n=1 Tax=Anguilla anguilla TaxID=7936 RepID=A0A0E9S9I5_ANGAN